MYKKIYNPLQLLILVAAFVLYGCDADDDLPDEIGQGGEIEQPESGLRTVQSNGLEREYYLQVPGDPLDELVTLNASAVEGAPPIIIAYHGYTGSYTNWVGPDRFYDLLDLVADEVVFVAPNALPDPSGEPNWGGDNDLMFFADLLDELVSIGVQFDPEQVFVVGHSNGAGFAHEIGCRYGDLVRAIAVAAGSLVSRDCVGSIGVLQMQGSNDPLTAGDLAIGARNFWVLYNGWEQEVFADATVGPCDDYSTDEKPDNQPYPVIYCEHTQGHDWPDYGSETTWNFFSGLSRAAPTFDAPPGGGIDNAVSPADANLILQFDLPAEMGTPLTAAITLRSLSYVDNPTCSAPDTILNYPYDISGQIVPGEVSERITIPIFYDLFGAPVSFPDERALSITIYVDGGSTSVIPAAGIDYDTAVPISLIDKNTDIILDEVVTLEPVQDLCGFGD